MENRHNMADETTKWRRAAVVGVVVLSMVVWSPAANKPRILQTNSAGDNIHLIDPATDKVVGEITGIEVSHGVAVSPNGKRIYVSNESESTLDIVDGKTLKVIKQIPLSGGPNNIALSPDGRRVYIAIRKNPGGVDVVDTASEKRVKTIVTGDQIHNTYVTPDGKFVIAGSQQGRKVSVIDAKTEEVAWTVPMGLGVRPMAMSVNPDGSTKWLFVQMSALNGFAVVDFATHKEIKRIKHPNIAPGRTPLPPRGEISHGMAVTKDQKTLLVCSVMNRAMYAYSLPDLEVIGTAELSGKGSSWVTLSPDNKKAYVANSMTNNVSVVDVASMKEITTIPVGWVPKRSTLGMLPQ
ncbi:MAG TPA: cytochrome D1 domain-containing protein [Terriglobales bacterium]|nr:cytochrome D1 domain-containing protein [Terriglobales bacterium]